MAQKNTKPVKHKKKKNKLLWLVISAAGLFLFLVAAYLLAGNGRGAKKPIEVSGSPAIRVDQEVFEYGDVKLGGTPIKTEVRVTNVGDETLRFTEAPYVEVVEGC